MKNTDTEILEIVELANGDIALRRPDTETEPLVSIRFSEESRHFLGKIRPLIAKAMIEAGIQAVQDLREPSWDEADLDEDDLEAVFEQELEQLTNTKPARKSVLH
ncbi:MAG TPA: hypothetical protein PKE57_11155 [Cellvibrionaceae bacterium]|nr:hypothetical protein [Cellvibrionaceae bacterium]